MRGVTVTDRTGKGCRGTGVEEEEESAATETLQRHEPKCWWFRGLSLRAEQQSNSQTA